MNSYEGITFDNNINYKISYFKQIFSAQHEAEVVIDEWIRKFCNTWLKEEFHQQRGANYYERRHYLYDYANGYYKRRLLTARGSFVLKVPRGRKKQYKYTLFDKYKRYSRQFEDIVVESLFLGYSTRDAKRFFSKAFGSGTISHALASRILRRFDYEIEQWKNKPINKAVEVLVIDAVHLKGAKTRIKKAKPVLCAYCIYNDGTEEMVDFEVAGSESMSAWSRFCGRIYQRGINKVPIVVSDDNKGLKEAIALYWPQAKHQFCVFHFIQYFAKLLKGLGYKRRREIIKAVNSFYQAEGKTAFYGKLTKIMAVYRQMKQHRAFRYFYLVLKKRYNSMQYQMLLGRQQRLQTASSFKEIKRRGKAFGRFPNTLSCQRWLYALIKEGLTPQYRRIKLSASFKSTQNS